MAYKLLALAYSNFYTIIVLFRVRAVSRESQELKLARNKEGRPVCTGRALPSKRRAAFSVLRAKRHPISEISQAQATFHKKCGIQNATARKDDFCYRAILACISHTRLTPFSGQSTATHTTLNPIWPAQPSGTSYCGTSYCGNYERLKGFYRPGSRGAVSRPNR